MFTSVFTLPGHQCLVGNAAVPPVNAAGNGLAVADLIWGRLRA
uniref:Uncharacterized protein n=1 Tax=Zea mays TaxID=4577 RepID=B6UHV5_MAIZE|nr:hypothetical protein [Zea mays]